MATMGDIAVRQRVFEHSGDSRLTDTQARGNITGGMTMGGQGKDVFHLSRGYGKHEEVWILKVLCST